MKKSEISGFLKSFADPERAKHSMKIFKTAEGEYGFGDEFLGVRVPDIRKAVREFRNTPTEIVEEFLKSPYHEERLFALLFMVYRFSHSGPEEQERIYNLYIANTRFINNWDLVDSSAHFIVGAYLEGRDPSVLFRMAKSDLLWDRRIAIISTFHFIKKDKFDLTLEISELLLEDEEDLIQKAVGWMLREVGKRNPEVEKEFLKTRYKKMPRTMLRYAIEKFSIEERKMYLKGKI